MPELPEVETMCRGIRSVEGRQIAKVHFPKTDFRPIAVSPNRTTFRRRVTGRVVQRIERLGKRVVLRLDGDLAVVIEPRMTGLVLLADPPDHEHLRLAFEWHESRAQWLWFWDRRGLGTVSALTANEWNERFADGRLGPDALQLTADQMRERLASSRREIKVAMLDQRALAGIGNLYASEILHLAGVHPATRCDRLRRMQWQSLWLATQEVLHEAIRYEGSTLGDGTYRNALNQAGRYQNCHRVYMRAGEACPRCQTGTIRRIVQAQRSTFFCPDCQSRR